MFGSQALETAIGLALVFWVLASGASAIVEGFSRLVNKRAKDLEATIYGMLTGRTTYDQQSLDHSPELAAFRGTSVYAAALIAAKQGRRILSVDRVKPGYLSARAFADALTELLDEEDLFAEVTQWKGLRQRLRALTADADADVLDVKAGLESWFDETMGRLQDAYKQWATAVLFVVGLALAVVGNISTIDTAQSLWIEPVTRQAAIAAASGNATLGATAAANVQTIQDLQQLGLPLGWHQWPGLSWWWVPHLLGWLITALLVMLGAPFWFDALSRLVSLRTSGTKPPPAAQDQASAMTQKAASSSSPPSATTVTVGTTGSDGPPATVTIGTDGGQVPGPGPAFAQPSAVSLSTKIRDAVRGPTS